MYRLVYTTQAKKALAKRLVLRDAQRIQRELHKLAARPDRRDLDIDTLTGRPGYRLRLGATRIIFTRIIFTRDDKTQTIRVLRIAPRGAAYKR